MTELATLDDHGVLTDATTLQIRPDRAHLGVADRKRPAPPLARVG